MNPLLTAILRCAVRHEEAVARWGAETPEDLLPAGHPLRAKMRRQREHVERTLEGCEPAEHVRHIEALLRGLELVEKELEDGHSQEARLLASQVG